MTTASAAGMDPLWQNAKKDCYAKVLLKLLLFLRFKSFYFAKIFFEIPFFRRKNLDMCVHNGSEFFLRSPSFCFSIYSSIQGRFELFTVGA